MIWVKVILGGLAAIAFLAACGMDRNEGPGGSVLIGLLLTAGAVFL
jgi:hypothetical protein